MTTLRKILWIAACTPAVLAIVSLVAYGYHNIQYGADARLRAARARDVRTLASVPAQREQVQKDRQASIKQAKALWGGPQQVNVIKKGAVTKIDNTYYTTAELEVVGAKPPLTIQRLVPTELTDRSPFKLWWCAKPSPGCNPAIGFSTAIDDSRKPYDARIDQVSQYYDKQLAALPTKASLAKAYTRSDAVRSSMSHNWYFMWPVYMIAFVIFVIVVLAVAVLALTALDWLLGGW